MQRILSILFYTTLMKSLRTYRIGILGLALSLGAAIYANAAPQAQIKVSLFGQPCLLIGPLSESTLKAIHAISPEQMPPPKTEEQTQKQLEKVKSAAQVPSSLDRYREQLTRRLEAQTALFEGLAAATKAGSIAPLSQKVSPYLSKRRTKDFEAQLKAIDAKQKPGAWNTATLDQISEAFETALDSSPEEEFHRAIGRLNIRYQCAFEEGE